MGKPQSTRPGVGSLPDGWAYLILSYEEGRYSHLTEEATETQEFARAMHLVKSRARSDPSSARFQSICSQLPQIWQG